MNCDDRETATSPRCRKRAQVKVTYTVLGGCQRQTNKCWQHYLDIEERARQPKARFRIIKAEAI